MVLLTAWIREQLGASLLGSQLGPLVHGLEGRARLGHVVNALVAFILIALGVFVGNALVLNFRGSRTAACCALVTAARRPPGCGRRSDPASDRSPMRVPTRVVSVAQEPQGEQPPERPLHALHVIPPLD